MRAFLLPLLAVVLVAADDPWAKVQELKSGTEIRVWRKARPQPLEAKLGDATPENLIVIVKSEQSAIPKDEIERLDMRPYQAKLKKESITKQEPPKVDTTGPVVRQAGPSGSTSTSYSFGKPDWETVYRRPTGSPQQ